MDGRDSWMGESVGFWGEGVDWVDSEDWVDGVDWVDWVD